MFRHVCSEPKNNMKTISNLQKMPSAVTDLSKGHRDSTARCGSHHLWALAFLLIRTGVCFVWDVCVPNWCCLNSFFGSQLFWRHEKSWKFTGCQPFWRCSTHRSHLPAAEDRSSGVDRMMVRRQLWKSEPPANAEVYHLLKKTVQTGRYHIF